MDMKLVFCVLVCLSYAVGHDKIVACYYGSWSAYRSGLGYFDVEKIDPHLCTHYIYAFAGIDYNSNAVSLDPYLDLPDNWGKDFYGKFTALKTQNPRLKTLLAIGGWNEGSAKFSLMAESVVLRQKFIQSVLKLIKTHGFDGVDVDWEYPNQRDSVNGARDVENFGLLIEELKETFEPYGLLVTAAVSAVEASAALSYDVRTIAKSLDFINLMTYDMNGPWDTYTGHNAPLFRGEGDEGVVKSQLHTVEVAVEYWLAQGCPPEKLVMGIPFYGRTYRLANAIDNYVRAPAVGVGMAGPYTATQGWVGFNEFCYMLRVENWQEAYDYLADVPYATRDLQWVSYDNAESISSKVNYALEMKLGGVMVWSIETDDFNGVCYGEEHYLLKTINRTLEGVKVSTSTTLPTTTTTTTSTTTKATTKATTVSPESTTICKSEGYTDNPVDCGSFYVCVLEANGSYVGHIFKCPEGLLWDSALQVCNYASAVTCKTINGRVKGVVYV